MDFRGIVLFELGELEHGNGPELREKLVLHGRQTDMEEASSE